MASLVVLDPSLLAGCPRLTIAASGMDASVQAVESYVSRHATWLSDLSALRAVRLVAIAWPAVYEEANGKAARDLLQGSFLAGLPLSMAR